VKIRLVLLSLCIPFIVRAQRPAYTPKHFVAQSDTIDFRPSRAVKNGVSKTYIETSISFYDVDDNNTTAIKGNLPVLLYIESEMKNNKKNGVCRQYVIDSLDHKKLYLIAEQTYANDKLNGPWKIYNLKGTMVSLQSFKDDSLSGISRMYWIDGKKIMSEADYFNGTKKFITRDFFKNGKVARETMIVNMVPNGEVKEYYESGVLKDKYSVKNGMRDGLRTYYYPDGKPWIQTIYKEDKTWTIVANYDSKGNKRNAGTLTEGNGTMILYDDDTIIRQIITLKNGIEQK
jgi:antitoxin component YwqK of YwqJK toxin-antitoxin module